MANYISIRDLIEQTAKKCPEGTPSESTVLFAFAPKNSCPDAVVFQICDTDAVFLAPYVAPNNSSYKNQQIFVIISKIVEIFRNKYVYVIGDINARCGTPAHPSLEYLRNPDVTINSYGRKLTSVCHDNNLTIVNGLMYKHRRFDSDFTYYRGSVKSQNDWCITNSVRSIQSFCILPKLQLSDHTPCALTIDCKHSLPVTLLDKIAGGVFDYSYYDRSNVLKPKVFLNKLNINSDLFTRFENIANDINDSLCSGANIDDLSAQISESLHSLCRSVSKRRVPSVHIPESKKALSSKNFHAIADANFQMYTRLISRNSPMSEALPYLLVWQENEKFAAKRENEEYNVRKNKGWKHVSKNDPRSMWKRIDYKEKQGGMSNACINPKVIDSYFRDIFQATHLSVNPTIENVESDVAKYSFYCKSLDETFTRNEVDSAICQIGRGIGLDGIEKKIASLFPPSLRDALTKFLNAVFYGSYPRDWRQQILRPEEKKGHSIEKPKLRGVAISSLLPTIYDIVLDNRFKCWFNVNSEQAGFREGQGCMVQIFAIYLLIELANSCNETIFIGFVDYEKAFDFTNRAEIVKDLMQYNAGATFTKSVSNMYQSTYYVPKVTAQRTGKPILAKHGVTQGRKSSTNLFSFAIRDIPKAVSVNNSFLQGNNVLQLADDASIITNSHHYLGVAFRQLINKSKEKFMITNLTKTFFLHLWKEPVLQPIKISDTHCIQHAENNRHLYLGMWITSSNDIVDHIKCNLSRRKFQLVKYYDWLAVNEMTPINIKLQVLDSCMWAAYLYGCESWWKVDYVAESLLAEERKILRKVLHVKSNTPNDIIYIELNRCDIITNIKHKQQKFFKRFKMLKQEDSVSRKILDLCLHLDICKYYESLEDDIVTNSKTQMATRISHSAATYNSRYHSITECKYNPTIYNEFLSEYKRIIISQWRLSNHRLRVETGRYDSPKIIRNQRVCSVCPLEVEDENHAIFECPLYNENRIMFKHLFDSYTSVREFLNPRCFKDAELLGSFLMSIENTRKSHGLECLT